MKKVLILAALTATLFSCSTDSTQEDVPQSSSVTKQTKMLEEEADPDVRVRVKWEIGRKSRNCLGIGYAAERL